MEKYIISLLCNRYKVKIKLRKKFIGAIVDVVFFSIEIYFICFPIEIYFIFSMEIYFIFFHWNLFYFILLMYY